MLNASKYPRASKYLHNMPEGLDSYPDCKVKYEAIDTMINKLSDLADDHELPAKMKQFIAGKWTEEWVPDVLSNTLLLIMRDVVFASDTQFLDWAYADSKQIFKKPLYKMLMMLMSPSLVVMGAAKRWDNFHAGTYIEAEPVKKIENTQKVVAVLTYPEHLFQGLVLERQGQAFKAAVESAGGKDCDVKVESLDATRGRFSLQWQ